MRRALLFPLMLAALIGAVASNSASAQERDLPGAAANRAVPDVSAIEQRLRDRGVSEDRIGIAIARIRAAIASGNYPHLERRLYNFLNQDSGDDANRRRLAGENDRRPDVASVRGEDRPEEVRPAVPAAPRVADTRSAVLAAPGIARRQ